MFLAKIPEVPKISQVKDLINNPSTNPNNVVTNFYNAWHSYFGWPFMTIIYEVLGVFGNGLLWILFECTNALESAFNAAFSLLGWSGNLASPGSPLHGIYMILEITGFSMLAVGLLVLAFQSSFHNVNWGKTFQNLIVVGLILGVLPVTMRSIGSAVNNSNSTPGVLDIVKVVKEGVEGAPIDGKVQPAKTASLAVQPAQNNIIDLQKVASSDFKADPNSLNPADLNAIKSPQDMRTLDLGEVIAPKEIKELKKKDKKHKDSYELLQYKGELDNFSDGVKYSAAKLGDPIKGATFDDSAYHRYSVQWLPLLLQYVALAVILVVATVRVVKDGFELVGMQLIAPLLAWKSLRNTKALRDLISSIVGLAGSLVLLVVMIRVYLIFVALAPTKLPAGLGLLAKGLLTGLIYIGGGFALFGGVSYFERLTGVAQSMNDDFQQAAVTGALAGGVAGKMFSSAKNKVESTSLSSASSTAHGISGQSGKGLNPVGGSNATGNNGPQQAASVKGTQGHGLSGNSSGSDGSPSGGGQSNNTSQSSSDASSQNDSTNQTNSQSKSQDKSNQNDSASDSGKNLGQSDGTQPSAGHGLSNDPSQQNDPASDPAVNTQADNPLNKDDQKDQGNAPQNNVDIQKPNDSGLSNDNDQSDGVSSDAVSNAEGSGLNDSGQDQSEAPGSGGVDDGGAGLDDNASSSSAPSNSAPAQLDNSVQKQEKKGLADRSLDYARNHRFNLQGRVRGRESETFEDEQ